MNHKALHKLTYGLYVVTSRNGDRLNGQIANTVFQVTSEPPTIAISINKANLTWEFIKQSKAFAVSVLSKDTPLSFIGHFGFKSGRDIDKLDGINYNIGQTKSPIAIDYAVSYLEAKVTGEVDMSTHTIFLGEVVDADILNKKVSMTYDYYHKVKRGITPKKAPTYLEEERKVSNKMSKYKCSICGWVYDPKIGDKDGGIAPGVPFEKLPDKWVCPICGASKSEFEKIE